MANDFVNFFKNTNEKFNSISFEKQGMKNEMVLRYNNIYNISLMSSNEYFRGESLSLKISLKLQHEYANYILSTFGTLSVL